jgi:hypothetical protein
MMKTRADRINKKDKIRAYVCGFPEILTLAKTFSH